MRLVIALAFLALASAMELKPIELPPLAQKTEEQPPSIAIRAPVIQPVKVVDVVAPSLEADKVADAETPSVETVKDIDAGPLSEAVKVVDIATPSIEADKFVDADAPSPSIEAVKVALPILRLIPAASKVNVNSVKVVDTAPTDVPSSSLNSVDPVILSTAEIEPVKVVDTPAPIKLEDIILPEASLAPMIPDKTIVKVEPVKVVDEAIPSMKPVETETKVEPLKVVETAAPTQEVAEVAETVQIESVKVVETAPTPTQNTVHVAIPVIPQSPKITPSVEHVKVVDSPVYTVVSPEIVQVVDISVNTPIQQDTEPIVNEAVKVVDGPNSDGMIRPRLNEMNFAELNPTNLFNIDIGPCFVSPEVMRQVAEMAAHDTEAIYLPGPFAYNVQPLEVEPVKISDNPTITNELDAQMDPVIVVEHYNEDSAPFVFPEAYQDMKTIPREWLRSPQVEAQPNNFPPIPREWLRTPQVMEPNNLPPIPREWLRTPQVVEPNNLPPIPREWIRTPHIMEPNNLPPIPREWLRTPQVMEPNNLPPIPRELLRTSQVMDPNNLPPIPREWLRTPQVMEPNNLPPIPREWLRTPQVMEPNNLPPIPREWLRTPQVMQPNNLPPHLEPYFDVPHTPKVVPTDFLRNLVFQDFENINIQPEDHREPVVYDDYPAHLVGQQIPILR